MIFSKSLVGQSPQVDDFSIGHNGPGDHAASGVPGVTGRASSGVKKQLLLMPNGRPLKSSNKVTVKPITTPPNSAVQEGKQLVIMTYNRGVTGCGLLSVGLCILV